MRSYEIVLLVALTGLFFALGVITAVMRRQVHQARYGSQEISPWSIRYVNGLSGQYGIWNLHKRFYERSVVRLSFYAVLVSFLVLLALGACDYIYVRR